MGLKDAAVNIAVKEGIKYLRKDFDNNSIALIEKGKKKYADNELYLRAFNRLEEGLKRPGNKWADFIKSLIVDTDPEVLEKLVKPIISTFFKSYEKRVESIEKYDCNVPWAILMDITTACNLKCTGCWASEYDKTKQLTYDDICKIIREGKELGTYAYLYTGGEPLMRKKDLIRICEENPDCLFLSFTNGTLCDDAFADDVRRVGNLLLAFSIEGSEETTDARRGKGTYKAVIDAMARLKSRGVPFGTSLCCTKENTDVIASDEYADFLVSQGVVFAWYFLYVPAAYGAGSELMADARQRELLYDQIRKWRFKETKPLFTIDFFNDSEYVGGCIAGGKQYFHISANGDCEPCVFVHYSNVNIKEKSLLEALRSPLFMAYRARQPFSDNMLRPCPVMDNPGALKKMLYDTNAKSTALEGAESYDVLFNKTVDVAKIWKETADRMAQEHGFLTKRLRSIDLYSDVEAKRLRDFKEFE
ncbi:MAG: radical SAM protein [Clostridiales bacterium]|jgi:MoaA/NifB/PqqE/SkfB family radical SAM enzyme|nr:radical SAM protein [Clostridiales bacterium]